MKLTKHIHITTINSISYTYQNQTNNAQKTQTQINVKTTNHKRHQKYKNYDFKNLHNTIHRTHTKHNYIYMQISFQITTFIDKELNIFTLLP